MTLYLMLLRRILKARTPTLLQTDYGLEFMDKKAQALLESHYIERFQTCNTVQAQNVERLNQALNDGMYNYFTANKNKRWIDVLHDLVYNYNESYHSSMKMPPTEATLNPR